MEYMPQRHNLHIDLIVHCIKKGKICNGMSSCCYFLSIQCNSYANVLFDSLTVQWKYIGFIIKYRQFKLEKFVRSLNPPTALKLSKEQFYDKGTRRAVSKFLLMMAMSDVSGNFHNLNFKCGWNTEINKLLYLIDIIISTVLHMCKEQY